MSVTQATLLGDTFGSQASGTIPVGGIIMWSGSIIPSGWALCNGANGTPNLVDRFVVGASSTESGATAYPGLSPGATGGSANAVVVSHSHGVSDPGHSHGVSDPGHSHSLTAARQTGNAQDGSNDRECQNQNFNTNAAFTGISINGATANITINSTGSSGVGANLPPYYALAFIMRVS